jgi:predicted ATPase/tRNA A-37 threonylcarbamoyl transferase component Bud32
MAEDARAYLGVRLKGRYLIETHIGSGLSAHAFKAYDTLLQGRVVVKIIKNAIAGVPIDLGEEWKQESRKAMQVRGHPHIASILDLGEENLRLDGEEEQVHFIVTEYIEGTTLRELGAEGPTLAPHALFTVAHQLLGTLDFLQTHKLSHGDLHGGNIMVSSLGADRPFIKVIDFGMASNTLIPRSREKDIHFALSQLDFLCQKSLEATTEPHNRYALEGFAALLKKAQNFIPTGRMTISDIVAEIEALQQQLAKRAPAETKALTADEGPRRRIAVQRRTPFVGRGNEVEHMYRTTMGSFIAKRGAMLFVSGEAGIGKTRLVDEVLGRISAERTRHLLLYRKCPHQEPHLPYAPLFEAIVHFLDDIPGDNDETKLGVVLGADHSLVRPLAALVNEQRAARRGDSAALPEAGPATNTPYLLASFLSQAALNTPVVLFLDDLHWADKPTIEFLQFLAPRIEEAPIVIFATHRPEDLTPAPEGGIHPLLRLLKELGKDGSCEIIDLPGIDHEAVEEILSNLYTFVKPADFTALSDAVGRMAGGNPFYLFEITGLMEDEGFLARRGESQWVLQGDLAEFSVPASIHSLIERRVARLSLNEILFLRAGALQGEGFELGILERMFSPPDQQLSEIVDSLVNRHGLIHARETGRFVFCHHQVHRAILGAVSQEDAVRGHRDVARLLEESANEDQASQPHHLIAHHLSAANRPREAAEHFLAAGRRALEAQQFHMAFDHMRRAADLLTPPDPEDELTAEVTLALLEAAKPIGERETQERTVKLLQSLAEHSKNTSLRLRAMLEQCIYLRTVSDHEMSLKVAEELIEKAREVEDEASEAAALKEAGTSCYLMGNMGRAEEHFHRAAGILASTGDRAQLARVYNNLGLVCRNTGRQEEMVRYFQRALEIFREIGDSIGERFPLGNLGIVYFERGEYERAFECFTALKATLAIRADLMMEGKVDFSIGEIYLEVGLFEQAKEACEQALSTFLTIGNRQGESEVLGTLGGIHLAMGEIQIAREYFEQSIEVKQAIGNVVGMMHSKITLARIANLEGRQEDAIRQAEEVLADARERGLRSIELECLTEIMHARAQMHGPAKALSVLGPAESPERLDVTSSPALISFAYKAGELAFQAGKEGLALQYIDLSGKSVEAILENISISEWRKAYERKRERVLETYRRLKPAIANLTGRGS